MKREEGLRQIDEAKWEWDDLGVLNLITFDAEDWRIHAWMTMRPNCCDRGHIQLNIDGLFDLNEQDLFPRYFFSVEEADQHARTFLKWRLWKERTHSHEDLLRAFQAAGTVHGHPAMVRVSES